MPPSVNHTHRKAGRHVILSKGARRFRERVCEALASAGNPRLDGLLSVDVEVFPPVDNRKHDIDNIQKALLDALQHGGLYQDDSQIVKLSVSRCAQVKGGAVIVRARRV